MAGGGEGDLVAGCLDASAGESAQPDPVFDVSDYWFDGLSWQPVDGPVGFAFGESLAHPFQVGMPDPVGGTGRVLAAGDQPVRAGAVTLPVL